MTGVSLTYLWFFFFFFIILTENYLFYFFRIIKKKNKYTHFTSTNILSTGLQNKAYGQYCIIILTILILTLKVNKLNYNGIANLFFFYTILILSILYYFRNYWDLFTGNKNFLSIFHIVFFLLFLLYFFTITYNFIIIILLIEMITTLYYFFFLQFSQQNYTSILKYKNLISYYLWLSFFTLVFFTISILLLSINYGTVNYKEVNYFYISNYIFYFIFISLSFKLGIPGFHFFKLELYKYLPINTLILFSIFGLVINMFIFFFILYLLYPLIINSVYIIFFVLIVNILLLLVNIDKVSIFYFFALSSINTWAFFLMVFLF